MSAYLLSFRCHLPGTCCHSGVICQVLVVIQVSSARYLLSFRCHLPGTCCHSGVICQVLVVIQVSSARYLLSFRCHLQVLVVIQVSSARYLLSFRCHLPGTWCYLGVHMKKLLKNKNIRSGRWILDKRTTKKLKA